MVNIELTDAGLKELEDERVYVPEEVELCRGNTYHSVGVINSIRQTLFKLHNHKSFSVTNNAISGNRGDNFFYREVEKPVESKTYFVGDSSIISQPREYLLNKLRYVVFLNDLHYTRWGTSDGFFEARIYKYNWSCCYEIVEV